MKSYSSYKDSGVEWIGQIPNHWETIKTYLISENLDGKREPLNSEERGDIQGDIPYWGSGGIVDYINKYIFDEELLLVGEDGSPFFDSYRDVSFYVNEKIWVNNHIHILRSKMEKINTKYLVNSFNCVEYKEYITGSTRDKLTQTDLNRIIHPVPPIPEQTQIVSFLDTKIQKIDELIEKTEQKIKLLKEKRTSLINHCVTKGLNPDVEMKDSGVEWIGEIPSDWISTKFNRYVFFQEGPGLRTFQFTDEGTKVICVTNITEKGIDFSYKKFISTEEYLEKYQHFTVNKGDLLLSSSGNSWGKVSEYLEDEKVMLNTSTIRLNTLDERLISKNLIKHLLKSDLVRIQLDILMTGSCQPNFGPTHLNQLIIPIPPIGQQTQIVEHLDEQTQKIDSTIEKETQRIELLKKYRQSLVSEVVTGKIDVRDWNK